MGTKAFSFTKGLFSVLVALLLTFTLIACGGDNDQEIIDEAIEGLSIVFASGDSQTSVTRNLNLPTTLGDATITWSSNNTTVISNAGVVTRQFADVNVVLTATATLGDASATKPFTLTVIGHDVEAALESIVLTGDNISFNSTTNRYTVTGDITLPATANGLAVTWTSSNPTALTNAGVVTQPAYGQNDAVFVLTADINGDEREFSILVPAITDKPASLILEDAKNVLLLSGVGDGVSQNIVLPSQVTVVDGTETYVVTVTWVSSNTSIVTNLGVVNRPDDNTNVTLTATLTYQNETTTKTFDLVVLAATDTVLVENIAEAISISKDGLALVRTYVRINGVTVIGITGDGVVIADESGILFAYMGSRINTVTVGETYDVRGLTDRYFGSWQLNNFAVAGQPVVFSESDAEAFFPTPVEVDSVTDMLANHMIPDAENPDIEYVYYRLTAKIRIQNPADNYGTVFVNSDYAGGDIPTAANSAHTTEGVIVYYHSNKAAFDAFDGLVVTFNVLFYGYRSDRNIFSTLFVETVNDIETTLDDAGLVDVAETTLKASFASEYIENTTLTLPSTLIGTSITYTSSNEAIINSETGAVTLPAEGQVEVTLTATIVKGDVEKAVNIVILVGELELLTVAEVLEQALTAKVRFSGVVTGIITNRTFAIQDGTAAIAIFVPTADVATWIGRIGKEVEIIGTRAQFNGLQQVNPIEVEVGDDKPLPVFAEINDLPLTEEALLPYQSQYVTRTGLVVTAKAVDSFGNVTLTMKDPVTDETIQIRWDSRVVVEGGNIGAAEVDDIINLIGAPLGWFNAPRFEYSRADQIVYGEYVAPTDEARAEAVANTLVVPLEIEEGVTLTLPATGAFDATIVWVSSNAAVINAETGVVTLPAEGNVTVTLTATVTVGEAEFEKVFTITVGEIIRTVLYANAAAVNTVLTIEATISVVQFDSQDRAVVFVEDATAGIYLYKVPASFKDDLVVGNTIKVRANRAVFNDLAQLNNFVSIEVITTGVTVTPTVVTVPADLFDVQGQLVSVTGYLRQVYTGTPSDFHLVTEAGTFALRVGSSNDIPTANVDAIRAKLVGVAAGTEVTVVAGAGRFRANAQIMLFDADQITLGSVGSEAQLGAVAAALFVAPEGDNEVITNITLPVVGLLGSVVEWASDTPAVIAADGTVVRPVPGAEDAVVVLTYELKIGETVYKTGTVEYTVLAEEVQDVIYDLPEWRVFVNDWEGTAATLQGVNGELVMTLTNIASIGADNWKIQVIQDAFALGTGADNVGHMLLEAGKTYKVSFDARASVSGGITLAIGHAGGGWTPYHVQPNLIVTTETQNFVVEFTLPAEGDFSTLAQFKLEMGTLFGAQTAPQFFVLDNVMIEEKVGEDFVATELIVNGSMEQGAMVYTATAAYPAGEPTGNMVAETNNAALVGLDPTIFTVTAIQNNASAIVGVNTAGQIRVYGNRANGDGNSLTVSISEGYVITGVEFVFGPSTNGATAALTLGESIVNLASADVINQTQTYTDLGIGTFTLKNNHQAAEGSNGQVWILQIVITYEEVINTEETVTASYTGTTTNMAASPANNAELVSLDPTLFTVTSTLGQASVQVGLNASGQIRIYANRNNGDGNTLTFTIAEGFVITSVEFVFGASTNSPTATLTLGSDENLLLAADLTNTTMTYNALDITSFSLQNTQNTGGSGSNAQIYILSIVITYDVNPGTE